MRVKCIRETSRTQTSSAIPPPGIEDMAQMAMRKVNSATFFPRPRPVLFSDVESSGQGACPH